MSDKENIISTLEEIKTQTAGIGLDSAVISHKFIDKILSMLKEQEAVEPKKIKGYNPPMYTLYEYECEECKTPMMNKQPFCMGCGKPVKWK